MNRGLLVMSLLLAAACGRCEAAALVESGRLIEQAEVALRAHSVGIAGDLAFVPAGLSASRVEAEGELRLEAGGIDGPWPRKRVGVPVRIWSGDRLLQSRVVWFTVQWWVEAPVYAHDARAGTEFAAVDMHIVRTDLAGATGATGARPLANSGRFDAAPALRLQRAVRAGQPVLEDDFAPIPAVERRGQVVLAVSQGPIALKTVAVAQDDAELGDLVKVLPSGAHQWVEARVIARNEVAIEN